MADVDKFSPVAFDPQAYAAQRSATDPAFKRAFETLDDEFSALAVLLRARKEAGLTQVEVAQRMGIAAVSLARIEASMVSRKHAPCYVRRSPRLIGTPMSRIFSGRS